MKPFTLVAAVCFSLLFSLPSFSQIVSTRLGDGTGEDWEPAIMLFDGSYVYALWPHFAARTYKGTSGATCLPFSFKGKFGTTSAYMYSRCRITWTWRAVVIPRCPVNGNVVDAQLTIGANGRLYAS